MLLISVLASWDIFVGCGIICLEFRFRSGLISMLILTVGWFFDANAVGRHYYYFLCVCARFHRCPTDPGRYDGCSCLGAVCRSPLIPVVVMDLFIFRCRSLVTIDPGRRPGFDRHSRCPLLIVVVVVVVGEFVVFSTSASSMIDKPAVILRFSYLVFFCPPMDRPKPVGALR